MMVNVVKFINWMIFVFVNLLIFFISIVRGSCGLVFGRGWW